MTYKKVTYEQYCFIYYGCQWQGMTEKIVKKLKIDSSIVSSILREKTHLDFLEHSKKELTNEEIFDIQLKFKILFDIPMDKKPDECRTPDHLSEDEYLYCFCVASTYGHGIDSALGKYFNKHKSFLFNGLKAAKTMGKVKRAYERFLMLTDEQVLEIGMKKFDDWNLQSFSKRKIKNEFNTRWRQ